MSLPAGGDSGQRLPLHGGPRRRARDASHVHDALHHRARRGERENADDPEQQRAPAGAPSSRIRSARAAIPTVHSSPSPSARARVYDTSSDATSATMARATASSRRASGTPPSRKYRARPANTADSPTRSSVES